MTAVRKLVKYYVRPILNNSKNKDSLCLGSSRLYFDKIELITRNVKDINLGLLQKKLLVIQNHLCLFLKAMSIKDFKQKI